MAICLDQDEWREERERKATRRQDTSFCSTTDGWTSCASHVTAQILSWNYEAVCCVFKTHPLFKLHMGVNVVCGFLNLSHYTGKLYYSIPTMIILSQHLFVMVNCDQPICLSGNS